ncbi:MAG: hypothetical protein GY774_10635 [Planctomycetes bacterium]|nr:hypothetical protein [Planctomycetota bacterium]
MEKTVEVDEPLNWPARIENGVLVIEPISEITPNENGGQDVLLKMPSLKLINEFKVLHGIS